MASGGPRAQGGQQMSSQHSAFDASSAYGQAHHGQAASGHAAAAVHPGSMQHGGMQHGSNSSSSACGAGQAAGGGGGGVFYGADGMLYGGSSSSIRNSAAGAAFSGSTGSGFGAAAAYGGGYGGGYGSAMGASSQHQGQGQAAYFPQDLLYQGQGAQYQQGQGSGGFVGQGDSYGDQSGLDFGSGYEEDYGTMGYDLDWQDQRQAEWQERIQAQYFSRWSVDKQDEWQAYQAKFDVAHNGGFGSHHVLSPPQWEQLGQSQALPIEDARTAQEYRRKNEMQVISAFSNSNVPPPCRSFEASGLPPAVLKEMADAKFAEPTPIQAQCWPILAAGHDVIGIAKSGSGKTLGFLGPGFTACFRSLCVDTSKGGPLVLVLAPTRELARQIQLEALRFGRSSGVLCCAATGGEPKGEQLEWLKLGCHVIVATPGRLNEFLEQRHVSLSQVCYAVLDEADRMLDMGFEPQIRRIIEECPQGPERQTLLFSATWPKAVRQLAFDFLRRPIHVHIGEMNAAKANTDVTQEVVLLDSMMDKGPALDDVLAEHLPQDSSGDLAIVFVSTKKACREVARRLQLRNLGVAEIHGDKDQRERDVALHEFTQKRKNVLIATDVASRGLDIKGVKLVVNYDAANTPEDHVHRIGRTGRAGEKGLSYTFLVRGDSGDVRKARAVMEVMDTAGQMVPEDLRLLAAAPAPRGGSGKGFKGGKGSGRGAFKGGRGGSKGCGGFRGGFGGKGLGGSP